MARTPALNKRRVDLLIHEEARRNLPVGIYLMLLNQAAQTGVMPILDDKGKPTGQGTELNGAQRLDVAKYLIDKVLPDVPKEVYHIAQADPAAEIPIERIVNASVADLRRIIAGTLIDAEFEKNATQPEP